MNDQNPEFPTPNEQDLYDQMERTVHELFDLARSLPPTEAVKFADGIHSLNACHCELHRRRRDEAKLDLRRCSEMALRSHDHLGDVYQVQKEEARNTQFSESLSIRLLRFASVTAMRSPNTLRPQHESLSEWLEAWYEKRYQAEPS